LYEQQNKIYITGSNAKLLSRELGTHLTGRTVQLEVFPLSFKEIIMHESPKLIDQKIFSSVDSGLILNLLSSYKTYGGIPEYYKFRKDEYIKNLYEGIIYRDIIARYHLAHEKALKELVYYFASNIGKEFSYHNLSQILGLKSSHTISNYCSYLQDCYMCFFINRYSHSLKKQLVYHKKCYMIDPALIRLIGFRVSQDLGRMLENIVFLHLKMLGLEIYFHKDKRECDFLVREGNQIVQAIQVAVHLNEQKIRAREIEGLLEAMKTYGLETGIIITENDQEELKVQEYQIKVVPIWKWLLNYPIVN
jgi:predicted AAA+ superfamily ATPase